MYRVTYTTHTNTQTLELYVCSLAGLDLTGQSVKTQLYTVAAPFMAGEAEAQ